MTKKRLLKAMAIATIATGLMACSGNSSESTDDTTVATTSGTTTTVDTATVKANASYTIGYGMGSSISEDENLKGFGINNDKVQTGFEDAINKKEPAVSQADMDKNMTYLREQMMEKMNAEKISSFLKVSESIYNSDLTPKTDVKDPAVVIYEFFDYQCMYCSKVSPEIDKAMADHKDTQVAFVEFPIFGERAPASEYAAEVGTAVYKTYGSAAYVKFHDGIFATGEDEGKLKNDTVDKVALESVSDIKDADIAAIKATIKDDKIAEHLKATLEMGFKDLGIQGTPYIVVAPAKDANASNTTVIAGYSDQAGITAAIVKAKTAKA
ncbi:MAG: protein-disulfide isomerase [Francisella sp.]|jgi:protein-disulfide isomerase